MKYHGRAFFLLACVLAWLLILSPVAAQAPDAPPTLLLASETVEPERHHAAVVDATWTLQQVMEKPVAFKPVASDTVFGFDARSVVWLRLRVQPRSHARWVLEFPLPVLDRVTVYQQNAQGAWIAATAGDRLPVNTWPEAGRYPFFRLETRGDAPLDLYIRVQHSTRIAIPLRIVTTPTHDYRSQLEFLGLGMALGALALVVAGGIMRTWLLRDRAYGWFTGHALLSTLAVAAFTGVAGQWLWPPWTAWIDASPGCLAILAGSTALLLVRDVTALPTRNPTLATVIATFAFLGPLLAIGYFLAERRFGVVLLGGYLVVVAVTSLMASVITWRRGDPVGRWMTLGSLPLAAAVLLAVARIYNWVEATWVTEYAVVMALTFDLPMLLAALNSRSRERRASKLRELAASHQDPLTGLLKGRPFASRLQQAVARFEKRGEGAAVIVIDVSNYEWIKSHAGAEAAEQSLLRAVIKLRRLVRDVDTMARLGEARFGVILEGVSSRAIITEFASRLIAWGLMPEQDSPSEPLLQFHAAAMLLHDFQPLPTSPLSALADLLAAMSPRTRRPFRILDAQQYSGGTSAPSEEGEEAPQGA